MEQHPQIRDEAPKALTPATQSWTTPMASRQSPPPEDWRRYGEALWNRKTLLLLSAIAGVLIGVVLQPLLPPTYRVSASLLAEGARIEDRPLLESGAWRDVVRSYTVLEDVVRRTQGFLSVADRADTVTFARLSARGDVRPGAYILDVSGDGTSYVLRDAKGLIIDRGAVGDSIGRQLGLAWAPPCCVLPHGAEVAFELSTMRDAAERLRGGLDVTVSPDGQLLHLTLDGEDPAKLVATLNGVVDNALSVSGSLIEAVRSEELDRLSSQLARADSALDAIERTEGDFRAASPLGALAPTGAGPGEIDPWLADYRRQVVDLAMVKADRDAIARALELSNTSDRIAALSAIEAVTAAPDLRAALTERIARRATLDSMQRRYTDDHPALRTPAEAVTMLETDRIPRLAQDLERSLSRRIVALETGLAQRSGEVRELARRDVRAARLAREAERAAAEYADLRRRFEESRLPAADLTALRVLDRAAPVRNPLSKDGPTLLLFGLGAGLGLAGIGVLVGERVAPRVRHPEQVSFEMGVPVLGAVPHLGGRGAVAPDGAARLRESFRGIRLATLHAHGKLPITLTVTSPDAGDGKSFVAANLAVALADAGHRTLLVDGDTRRARLHRLFDGHRGPGLTDVLRGSIAPAAAVQQTPVPGLEFLGAGSPTASAPELYESAAGERLMDVLRERYDAVIVDSPPMTSGIDALVLAALTRDLVLVLRAGTTPRQLAEVKLGMLGRMPVRVLGAVLNDVRNQGDYQRYSYYKAGYEPEEQAAGRLPPALR